MLKTRDECLALTEKSDVFYRISTEFQTPTKKYNVEFYDYRLASYNDFVDNDAFEMRGLCFVHDPDTNVFHRELGMQKFFNINENEDWLENKFVGQDFQAYYKIDGSLIRPVRFPDGFIHMKSQNSFISPQAKGAQEILNSSGAVAEFVQYCLDNDIVPFFEYIAFTNQIVIVYDNPELILLQIRKTNGEYIEYSELEVLAKKYGIKYAAKCEFNSLSEVLSEKETAINIEGWVLKIGDKFAKVKTQWYMDRHGIMTNDVVPHTIIKLVLNKGIDDLLSILEVGSSRRKYVEEIQTVVDNYVNLQIQESLKLRQIFLNEFESDKKRFSLKYRDHKAFHFCMQTLNCKYIELNNCVFERIKDFVLKSTRTKTLAENFIVENS